MQVQDSYDTIAAIATAEGPAGVAVVRISGPAAWQVAQRVVRNSGVCLMQQRSGRFFHASFADPVGGEVVDSGLVLLFRAPASYTGEDVVELQGHGGSVNSRAVLRAVLSAGARLANPGEFTCRAFLHGRMDLTQAEAVMDLVQARSARAAQAARAQLDGCLGREVDACYDALIALNADVSAQLDFEEGELPAQVRSDAQMRLELLQSRVAMLLATSRERRLLRDGVLVVIGGCPNVGKSSLLNALLGTNRAIVSSAAGTTRDTIEEGLVLDGIPIRLVDTAGLREASCLVEQEGVVRAYQVMQQADLVIYLVDASRQLSEQVHSLRQAAMQLSAQLLVVLNKVDLPVLVDISELNGLLQKMNVLPAIIQLSLKTGEGLSALKDAVVEKLGLDHQSPCHAIITERHGVELAKAVRSLGKVRELLARDTDSLVLAAGELRLASEALGRITGRNYTGDLLDAIFSRFCVGK